eukprot:GHVN01036774.1.p1 GENE.GHVN01036774.1~~GHVN01036774.1.p1  ORF type:complete len:256 (-),score=33.29 GHVN01036774.1:105-872(-)
MNEQNRVKAAETSETSRRDTINRIREKIDENNTNGKANTRWYDAFAQLAPVYEELDGLVNDNQLDAKLRRFYRNYDDNLQQFQDRAARVKDTGTYENDDQKKLQEWYQGLINIYDKIELPTSFTSLTPDLSSQRGAVGGHGRLEKTDEIDQIRREIDDNIVKGDEGENIDLYYDFAHLAPPNRDGLGEVAVNKLTKKSKNFYLDYDRRLIMFQDRAARVKDTGTYGNNDRERLQEWYQCLTNIYDTIELPTSPQH